MRYRHLLALLGAFAASPGCAAADAGKASTSVTVNLNGPFGDTATVTITSTVTPTSTATQAPENTVDVTATVPAGGVPR